MFRKLLFFILLAGIGFGIYTGINKAMDAFHAPKTIISPILSGAIAAKSGAISSIGLNTGLTTEDIIKTNEPGFFSRIWTKIKGLFTSETEQTSGTISDFTGTSELIFSGIAMSGFDFITGTEISGDILSGTINSGLDFNELASDQDSGKIEIVVKTGTDTVTQKSATKTTTTVKKPTTTKTTTKTTTTEKDPILDALFR